VGMDRGRHANVEVKYGGPDGVVVVCLETGWLAPRL
jgi:hypothetical protein